jgi:hypothetical protein
MIIIIITTTTIMTTTTTIATTPSPDTLHRAPHLRVGQVELVVINRGDLVVNVVVAEAAAEPLALRHSKLFQHGVFESDGDKNDDASEEGDGDHDADEGLEFEPVVINDAPKHGDCSSDFRARIFKRLRCASWKGLG